MKLKTLVILVAVLAVLSGIAYWSNRPSAPAAADPRVGQPLADAAAIAGATQLRLTDQGKTVSLAKQPDGSWRVSSYYDLPADFSKLSSLTSDLTTAKIQRLVTTSPDRIARLEFKDTKIEFLDAAGHSLWSVILGKTPDSGGRFVRFGDEAKAYLTDLNSQIDVEGKDWANAALLALKPDDIAKVEIPFDSGGPITISRAKPGATWAADPAPAGKTVKADTINSLLTSLGALRFSDTSDPADPQVAIARQHPRTFTLTTFDGKRYVIALGRKPEEKKPKPPAPPASAPAPTPATSANGPAATSSPATSADASATPPSPDAAAAPPADTIPAGPVYVSVSSSDAKDPVNALMGKRAYQLDDYVFTSLPQKPDDLFDSAAPPASSASAPSPGSATDKAKP
jgi:hypothetical protein